MIATSSNADPGCLKVIQGKVITDQAAKLLPKDCQAFRKNYLKSLSLLSVSSAQFSQELSKQILAKKSFEPPYDAILISTFSKNISDELKSAIHVRAQIETHKKIKYKYALAVEERLKSGSCSAQFSESVYDEVCRGKDLVFDRIEKLQSVQNGEKR